MCLGNPMISGIVDFANRVLNENIYVHKVVIVCMRNSKETGFKTQRRRRLGVQVLYLEHKNLVHTFIETCCAVQTLTNVIAIVYANFMPLIRMA